MKVKRYEIVSKTTVKDLLKCGAKEFGNTLVFDKYIEVRNSDILIHLSFTRNPNEWNDVDGVSVIDTDAGQLYKPFYVCRNNDSETNSKAVNLLISEYNSFMDSLSFLKVKQ